MVSGLGGRVVSGLGFVLGVDGGTFVTDISDVTVVVVSGVSDGLDTAVGKSHLVRSSDGLAVSGLLGVEVGARVVVLDTVLESVGFGGFVINWGLAVSRSWGVIRSRGRGVAWGRGSSGDSHSGRHESDEDDAKHDKYVSVHKLELMLNETVPRFIYHGLRCHVAS